MAPFGVDVGSICAFLGSNFSNILFFSRLGVFLVSLLLFLSFHGWLVGLVGSFGGWLVGWLVGLWVWLVGWLAGRIEIDLNLNRINFVLI